MKLWSTRDPVRQPESPTVLMAISYRRRWRFRRWRLLGLAFRENVLMDVHGERDAGVAEAFADDCEVDALLQQDRGVGVAQVV